MMGHVELSHFYMVQNTAKNVSCITLAFCFHKNILRMTSESN